MTRRLGIAAGGSLCALVLALGGCGGDDGDDDAAPPTTAADSGSTTAPTPTAAPSTTATTADASAATTVAATAGGTGDEAFVAAFESQPSVQPGTGTVALGLAQSLCRTLASASDETVLDAAYETFSGTLGAEPAAAMLALAGDHLCPEHADTLDTYLTSRGFHPPA